MAQTVMRYNNPTLKVALTEAELATTGLAVECQANSAVVTAQPSYSTIPSTGCSGATQSPGLTAFQLDLVFLQDWTVDGLSRFAWDNDGKPAWVELAPDAGDPTATITGEVYVAAGSYGGTFGDGSAAQSTVAWPFIGKPDIAPATIP